MLPVEADDVVGTTVHIKRASGHIFGPLVPLNLSNKANNSWSTIATELSVSAMRCLSGLYLSH